MASRVTTARRLQRDQTNAERKLWFRLRDRRLHGLKFRRQMPIISYVVDFCCESARLVIELDGGQHSERNEADAKRTADLEAHGYLVLRFWNNDVLSNITVSLRRSSQRRVRNPLTLTLSPTGRGNTHERAASPHVR